MFELHLDLCHCCVLYTLTPGGHQSWQWQVLPAHLVNRLEMSWNKGWMCSIVRLLLLQSFLKSSQQYCNVASITDTSTCSRHRSGPLMYVQFTYLFMLWFLTSGHRYCTSLYIYVHLCWDEINHWKMLVLLKSVWWFLAFFCLHSRAPDEVCSPERGAPLGLADSSPTCQPRVESPHL